MSATAPIIRFPLLAALVFSLLSLGLDANRKTHPASPATRAAATQATEVPPDITAIRQVLNRVAAAIPDLTAVSVQPDHYYGGDTEVKSYFSLTAEPRLKDKTGRYNPDLDVSIQCYATPKIAAGHLIEVVQVGPDADEFYNGVHRSDIAATEAFGFS